MKFSRYNVGGIKLYSDNIELLKKSFPEYADNIKEIPILEEADKIKIKELIDLSVQIRGEIYSLPYNGGRILYRIMQHEGQYIDGIEYQRHDEHKLVEPVLKDICSIDKFYQIFCPKHELLPPTWLSKNEFDKIKPKPTCFDKKGPYGKYIDCMGYVYLVPKRAPWNKNGIELYNRFNDDPESAVYARIRSATFGYLKEARTDWFESEQFLIDECNKIESMSGVAYDIKQKGFNPKHPKDRKLIIRLPYFNFNAIKNIKGAAIGWVDSCKGFVTVRIEDKPSVVDLFEDIIIKYLEYKKTKQSVNCGTKNS